MVKANSEKEKREWINALEKAIEEDNKRRLSFSVNKEDSKYEHKSFAPVFQTKVDNCTLCQAKFAYPFKKAHHCKQCGKCVTLFYFILFYCLFIFLYTDM